MHWFSFSFLLQKARVNCLVNRLHLLFVARKKKKKLHWRVHMAVESHPLNVKIAVENHSQEGSHCSGKSFTTGSHCSRKSSTRGSFCSRKSSTRGSNCRGKSFTRGSKIIQPYLEPLGYITLVPCRQDHGIEILTSAIVKLGPSGCQALHSRPNLSHSHVTMSGNKT